VIGITLTITILFFVWQRTRPIRQNESIDSNVTRLRLVVTSIEMYKHDFGAYPGGDEKHITDSLVGKNPRQTVYIKGRRSYVEDGRLIDVWRTPLRMKCDNETGVVVQSAGPNRVFDDSDDYHLENPPAEATE
jgi:hypothetical protein